MTVFFTADQHFFHFNIIPHCNRPFDTIEEMNETFIANHNSIVRYDDTTWHCGDFSWHHNKIPYLLSRLNGRHNLVYGNHDLCWKSSKEIERYKAYGFEDVTFCKLLDIPGVGQALLSHLPLSFDDAHDLIFNTNKKNLLSHVNVFLCGHVHNNWKHQGKLLNIGVDVWNFTPVSIDQITKEMKDELTRI